MYLHTENKLRRSKLSKVTALQTDAQTDATDRTHHHAAFAGGNKPVDDNTRAANDIHSFS